MNIRILGRLAAIGAAAILLYVVYLLVFQWQQYAIADYTVRQNRITGMVEIKNEGQWTRPQDDPYAESIPAETLPYIALTDMAWGPKGLLCFRVENRTDKPIQGRLAFHVELKEIKLQRRLRDRELRVNLVLPVRKPVPIVLNTNLTTPDTTKVRTSLTLQPTAYSGQ